MGSSDGGGGGDEGSKKATMAPWEQHAAVISIPRFDYNAQASLLRHSLAGFLITCTIKREKSATKEAIAMLEKYCRQMSEADSNDSEPATCDDCGNAKRRKVTSEESDIDNGVNGGASESENNKSKDERDNPSEHASSTPQEEDPEARRNSPLSLVKLTRSGLVLFTFPKGYDADTVHIVSQIIESVKTGNRGLPQWCHRILPIQATCILEEQILQTVVQNLVIQFMKHKKESSNQPIKFAVGYNRRGIEETELKTLKNTSENTGSDKYPLLDRNKCFGVVAGAVKGVIPESAVDLKTPEFCVLVELLPLSLSAVPSRSLVVAVSVLPENLITTKPRLCVRALAPDTKERKAKN